MKKTFVVLGALMLVVVMGVFVGCKPEDTTPPEISITVKATDNYRSELFSDSIKGIVEVIATATDDVGVDTVRFFVNDEHVGQPMTEPNGEGENEYVYKWQTQELEDNVVYTIGAKAYDAARNEGVSNSLSYLIRIPNDPPNKANLMTPENDKTLQLASLILKWQGSDPDKYPKQELTFEVWFGEGSSGKMELVNMATKGTYPDTGSWGTLEWEHDPPYLHPEQDYYWMILSRDPYGQGTESDIYHFARGTNRVPSAYSPTPPDTFVPIDPPASGFVKLLWRPDDPDGDPLTYDLYFAPDPEKDTVFVSDLGKLDSLMTAAEYSVEVSAAGVTYYWYPVPTDLWEATQDTTGLKAWRFVVGEE
ncbi:hypothetical protein CEE36_07450 [candidate division TA06 bacterium B3_TA06]|uniref:Fibronectin type-III domain-containing protein n=1 Tax=candidate division TA06 bacterium B3_TA06 TaxID=2012487 RepID=A0A532V4B8_UNCT6|nr:MAG: hypothetical protein CEE36_07450 [candidate division TA06 bacterium B3_TA06]